jgi:hypothetical protein
VVALRVGYHPYCKWNISLAQVEMQLKNDEEFTRTLDNLWTAWLKDHDHDGRGVHSSTLVTRPFIGVA